MHKRCLVLGSALCVWKDVDAALELSEFEGVVAAKRAGVLWRGELDAWVTLHPDRFKRDMEERAMNGYAPAKRVYSHMTEKRYPGITHQLQYRFKEQNNSGSSGLFAVKVALELGFTRLVLCGIPLSRKEGKLGFGSRWNNAEMFKRGFKEAFPLIRDYTRSMSGWTAELLGKPTEQWLTE